MATTTDQPWYANIFNAEKSLFGTALNFSLPSVLMPSAGVVKAVTKMPNISGSSISDGIKLSGSALDNVFSSPSVLLDSFLNLPSSAITNDSSKATGNHSDVNTGTSASSGMPDLPFWAKTAIVCSVIIGTILIVKGSFNNA